MDGLGKCVGYGEMTIALENPRETSVLEITSALERSYIDNNYLLLCSFYTNIFVIERIQITEVLLNAHFK